MPVASNDRKISQLPVAPKTEPDTNFLVVTGINTSPNNERISMQNLFANIPNSLVVGEEYSGHTVVFNASDDPTHRFVFMPDSGDVVVGHNLMVAGDVLVANNMTVGGTTTFANPIFIDLEIRGSILSKGTATFEENIETRKSVIIDRDLTIGLDAQINNNLNVDGGLVVGDDTSLQDVTAKSIEVAQAANAITMSANTMSTIDLNATGQTNVHNLYSTGFIQTQGNVIGRVAKLDALEIQDPSVFHDTVNFRSIRTDGNITANGDQTITGSLGVAGIGTFNLAETTDLKVNNEATIEKLNAVSLSTSVYSATPPIANLALGQIYIVENGGTVTLEVKTASGVIKKVALT